MFGGLLLEATFEAVSTRQNPMDALARPGFSRDAIEALSALKGEPDWMLQRRLQAWGVYEHTPMPTLQDEDWRRTDIRPLKMQAIVPYAAHQPGVNTRSLAPAEMTSEIA